MGVDCSVIIPLPAPTCAGYDTINCEQCIELNNLNLSCFWCASTSNVTLELATGVCMTFGAPCDQNDTLIGCVIPTIVIPPICPDNCTFHGTCQNVTVNQTSVLMCVCEAGYSGINCGEVAVSSSIIVAATLGTAVVVGIIIGVSACVGLTGAGTYAGYSRLGNNELNDVSSNPLYTPNAKGGDNPLHNDCN